MSSRGGLVVIALGALGGLGCGRIAFDRPADADAAVDTPAPRVCGPWSGAQLVSELESTSYESGEISRDGLTFNFASTRGGPPAQLYSASRPDRQSLFGTPTLMPGLSGTGQAEVDPTVTSDALDVMFSRTQCEWEAQRADSTSAWGTPVTHAVLCPTPIYADCGQLSADGLTLYYRRRENSTLSLIYVTHRTSRTQAFPVGDLLGGLPPTANCPYVTDDGLEMYLEDGNDVLHATRASATDLTFTTPVVVTEAMSASIDEDASITADGQELYFTSNRTGSGDIYRLTRTCQ